MRYRRRPMKRRRRYRPRQIGSKAMVKRNKFAADVIYNTRTLRQHDLTTILQTTSGAINRRERQVIFMRGVRVKFLSRNLLTRPLIWNWALVLDKQAGNTVLTENMFRGNDSTRGRNFSTALTSLDFATEALNGDRFKIFRRGRLTLRGWDMEQSASPAFLNNGGNNWGMVDRYIKLNTKVFYEDTTSGSAIQKISLIFWGDQVQAAAASNAVTNAVQTQMETVVYFNDIV